MRRRRFTASERAELGPYLARARWLLDNAPDDLYEQLREVFCAEPPRSVSEMGEKLARAEELAKAYEPRRDTPFRTNVRLLHAKGLSPKEIAAEIGTSANSVRVTLHRIRELDKAA